MADGSSVYRHHSRTWSDERTDQLKAMWAEGLSASQIAKELGGVTRSAVLGKACRLDLPSRDASQAGADRSVSPKPSAPRRFKPADHPRPPLPEVRAFVTGPNHSPAATPPHLLEEPTESGSRTILTLEAGECRWPLAMVGDERTFCGCKPQVGESAYCAKHRRASLSPNQKPPLSAKALRRWI